MDVPPPAPDEPYSLAAGIGQIQANDPTFDEKGFLQGAKAAFGMIVTAFAQGDTPTLRPLLSDDVYDNFAAAIRSRQSSGETLETKVVDIRDADLIEARMDGRTAFVTVKFISEQINVTRDSAGPSSTAIRSSRWKSWISGPSRATPGRATRTGR